MKKIILFYLLSLPLFVRSQEITVTFPDDFDLQENPEYDNWTYQQNTFFALPLSISFFNAIDSNSIVVSSSLISITGKSSMGREGKENFDSSK